MKKRLFALSVSFALFLIVFCSSVYGFSNYNSVLTNLSTSGDVTCNVGNTASFSVTATYTQGSASDLKYEWYFLPNIPGHNGNRLSDGNGISGSSTSNLRVTATKDREGSYYAVVRMFDSEALNSDTMRLTINEPAPQNPQPSAPVSNTQQPSNPYPSTPAQNTQRPSQNAALPDMPNPRITTSEDSICVDWLQVKAGNDYASNYGIRIDNEPHNNVFFTPYGSNIFYFRGLKAGTDYTIELWAENANGEKGPSFIKTVKTWGTAPAAPATTNPAAATPSPSPSPAPAATTPPSSATVSATAASAVKPAGTLPSQSTAPLPFTDVTPDMWFYDVVKFAYDSGIINGTSATTYSPYKGISRAEAITLAASIHQRYVQGNVTLTAGSDVWYSNFVKYAEDNNIVFPYSYSITGVSADFYYNEPLRRDEFIYIIYFALPEGALKEVKPYELGSTPDVDPLFYYAHQLEKMKSYGIISGADAAGNFLPELPINRAEVAVIVTKMLKNAYNLQ